MSETIQRGFTVRGRVQGVGFRWWTWRNASRLGLSGTVRNLPDGAVEVRVEGSPEAVERLEQLLREGPQSARVTSLEDFQLEESLPSDFQIVA